MVPPADGAIRILGIDPGTLRVGVGVIDCDGRGPRYVDCGVISAPRTQSVAARLFLIHEGLAGWIARHRPTVVAVEQVYVGKSTPSAIRVGEARGVALLCGARVGAEIAEYPPATVKRAIAGFGAADKVQMARWIARLLGLAEPPEPHDAADALAIALTHAHRWKLRQFEARVIDATPVRRLPGI